MTMSSAQQTEKQAIDFWYEAKLLVNIALPTVLVQFGAYFIYPQTASVVGRKLGTEELAGFSLGSLTGNMTCMAMIIGVLSAADTMMPRAFGAKRYDQVGILTIQSFVVCFLVLLIPTVPLLTAVDWVFQRLGQDPIAANLAVQWIRVYVLGVPFVLLFRVIQRFLACQHVVWPMVCGAIFGCVIVQPVLKVLIPVLGFQGSAVAIYASWCCSALSLVETRL